MEQQFKQPLIIALVVVLSTVVILLAVATILTFVSNPSSEVSDDSHEPRAQTDTAPVLFATMTHLEGGWTQATKNRGFFDKQAAYLRQAYDLAEAYDAIITIESEIPMAEAMVKWDDNVLQEALDRGQGVGTHCDISPSEAFTDSEIIEEFKKRKSAVDVLVDPSENLGCAGGGGLSDWYIGAVGAGFLYLDGTVGFHYLALPLAQRPDGWDNQAITKDYFHNVAPVEQDKQAYPFRISGVGFEEDPDGDLVVSVGALGGSIQSIAESEAQESRDAGCDVGCDFTQEDTDILVAQIRSLVEKRDPSRVMKLQVYIATQYYADPDMEYFFDQMHALQNEGIMQWASQKNVYEAFVEWES